MSRYKPNPLIKLFEKKNLISSNNLKKIGVCRDNLEVNVMKDLNSKIMLLDKIDMNLTDYVNRFDEKYLILGNEWKETKNVQDDIEVKDNGRRKNLILSNVEDSKKVSLLDVGAGSGDFLLDIQGKLGKVSAVEPNNGLQSLITKKLSHATVFKDMSKIREDFDVITAFHVIEHILDPIGFLSNLKKILKPNGFIIIETPHANEALLSIYQSKEYSDCTFWTEHVVIYTPNFLSNLCARYFKNISYIPTQRYNLANHLYWLSHGKPGGHFYFSHLVNQSLNADYAKALSQVCAEDTITFILRH